MRQLLGSFICALIMIFVIIPIGVTYFSWINSISPILTFISEIILFLAITFLFYYANEIERRR